MIHNHEVRSSILRPATRKHSKSLCSFCIYCRQTAPKGLDIGVAGRKSLLLKVGSGNVQAGREATMV